MDTMRPLDGSGPAKPQLQQDPGSTPVARVDAPAQVQPQRNDVEEQSAPATIAPSVDANQEVLDVAQVEATSLDSAAVSDLKDQVAQRRYILDATALVDQLMSDAAQLLPLSTADE